MTVVVDSNVLVSGWSGITVRKPRAIVGDQQW